MAIPERGERFRDFTLGGFDSAKIRAERPLVLIIWRIGCSTSRMTVPLFDRLQYAYPEAEVVGVAQESEADLHAYVMEQKLRSRQLADEDLAVTRLYEVDTVPAYWLTNALGDILETGVGWDRTQFETLCDAVAGLTGVGVRGVIRPEDGVPALKPG